MRYRGATALVTGASSGIGAEFAAALAERGASLVLVARRTDRLHTLAAKLRDRHGVRVTALAADLSRPQSAGQLHEALVKRCLTVSILINSAGLGATGPFADADTGAVYDQVAVNVTALTALTRVMLPDLLATNDGAIVNIASLLGYQPAPGMAVYAASKAYVLSFTEALAHELRHTPLRVLALSPGSTRTEFYATSATSEKGGTVPDTARGGGHRTARARRLPHPEPGRLGHQKPPQPRGAAPPPATSRPDHHGQLNTADMTFTGRR